MRRGVFVTGGTGFVGRRLLRALAASGRRVVALDRSGKIATGDGVEAVKGDLLDAASYRDALATCDVVLHLAASTGRATRAEHERVNTQGTRALVDASRSVGVESFVFVSSIAVTFTDLRGYHYAQTKAAAEDAVVASGLRYHIVRPTMILGPDAPVLAGLEKLSCLPIAVLPGSGKPLVEPVHVDDVVAYLAAVSRDDGCRNDIVELGGPETISIVELMRRIRLARRRNAGPVVRVPLWFFLVPLRLAEAVGVDRLLPVTAGQLSSFRFDGVGSRDRAPRAFVSTTDLDQMLAVTEQTSVPAAVPDKECDTFTNYLLGQEAGPYVRAKYVAAHSALPQLSSNGGFDRFLVRMAGKGGVLIRIADAYAALFARGSLLRKKLVLLLAILETCPPSYRRLDEPVGRGPLSALLALSFTAIGSGLALAAGAIVLIPTRLIFSLVSRSSK